MGRKQPAGHLLSNLGVEYNAHWTGLIKTSVQWKSWWKMLGESLGVLHKPQTNPVGFTTQADWYTITQCRLGFVKIKQNTRMTISSSATNYKITRTARLRKLHCLFAFNLCNFDLDPKSVINQSCWPSMLLSSSNGLHLVLGMCDPLKRNLAEAYFSKQAKVPVISFIGTSQTCSLGFTQRLMSGKINTSFTVPAETPWL